MRSNNRTKPRILHLRDRRARMVGRGGRIRTADRVPPKHVRYQAAPLPGDVKVTASGRRPRPQTRDRGYQAASAGPSFLTTRHGRPCATTAGRRNPSIRRTAVRHSSRVFVAELIGTTVLVIGGPGTAILATGGFFEGGSVEALGVAFAFGLALLAMAYAVGSVSGCHINPAVTIGLWLNRKIEAGLVPVYVVAQLVGATIGALIIWAIAAGAPGDFDPSTREFRRQRLGQPVARGLLVRSDGRDRDRDDRDPGVRRAVDHPPGVLARGRRSGRRA